MTLYLKYRPQLLSELDSVEVKNRLIRIFSSSYTPHAILFSGPRGTGKTSAARIIAKVLNCEKKDVEPCNSCDTCLSITEGRFMDVFEIDAASNRGIDEIRDLREKIKLAPVSAKFKVYIIDEVHMLTKEAFNALLKTLEEPPPHAVFILATTEADNLPATILSRCVKISFSKATTAEIVHCLERVVKGENLSITKELLTVIAKSSDGSFRDATKILEQAISENTLTVDTISEVLGREAATAEKFLRILLNNDPNQSLSEIKKLSEGGFNVRFLTEDILSLLHMVLLAKHDLEKDKVPKDLMKMIEKPELLYLIKLFSRVYTEIKQTSLPYLPLEIAVVEWCERKEVKNV